jgi:hypothetical protein
MSDDSTIGGRIDAAVARARTALDGLRTQLAETSAEVGAAVNAKVDEIQAAIDEIQAAAARPNQ